MGDKEISIDVSELNRLEICCPECHTGYVISFNPKDDSRLPAMCCNQQICTLAQDAVTNYRRFFANATASKMPFRFRVKAP
jgi:hypothetical protein